MAEERDLDAQRAAARATAQLAVERCRALPMVESAYLGQIYAPMTDQLTTPVLGLALSAPLPADAFGGWPAVEHPLVVFALGDDALSRLVRLAEPIYRRPPQHGLDLATAIAGAIGGALRELPSSPGDSLAWGVALPDGRVPVLVREFAAVMGVAVGGHTWHPALEPANPAVVGKVVLATVTWGREVPADRLTLTELAVDLCAALSEALGERWTVGIPGTPVPAEMWLHPPAFDAASVGLFPGRVIVWIGGEAREAHVQDRAGLEAARAHAIAGAREQLERYRRHVAATERARAAAEPLASRLAERLGGRCEVLQLRRASHESAVPATIRRHADGARRDVAVVREEDGALRVHVGAPGDDGWDGALEGATDPFPKIADEVDRALRLLTMDDLVTGARYRVLAPLQDLAQGAVVTYRGFDDIDNHYGEAVFAGADGATLKVGGDYSSGGPLEAAHRYLEHLPDEP